MVSAADFFASSRVLIVAGKGGVGKTTVGATLGLAAARAGATVLLVELEGLSNLAAPFDVERLAYDETTLERWPDGGHLLARQITPEVALKDYLNRSGLARVTNRMAQTGAVDVVATAAPGIRDLLALGKIRQLEQQADVDLIIVDAPAAGHAVTFLQAPAGMAASAASGPVRQQADLVLAMFADERRCQVILVTMPEEAPVNEVVETAYSLEDLVGIRLGPIIVNGCWEPISGLDEALERRQARGITPGQAEAAAAFRIDRMARQHDEVQRLRDELPLTQLKLPFLFTTSVERQHLDQLADALVDQLDRHWP